MIEMNVVAGGGLTVVTNQVDEHGCYCMRSMRKHEGYRKKVAWTEANTLNGLTYVQLKRGQKTAGFIEYAPGEQCWRVMHADGYIVIHCLWVGETGQGLGSQLVQLCLNEARRTGKKGVAVLTNEDNGWSPGRDIYVRNGFQLSAEGPYGFSLYAYSFGSEDKPFFPDNWAERLDRFNEGLTILRTDQCPYLETATANVMAAAEAAKISPSIIHIPDRKTMMELSPTPYGVFHVIFNGELVAYHRMTSRAFYKKLTGGS